jgi:predicted  nucleic acid-binding Zn-ribbon protein
MNDDQIDDLKQFVRTILTQQTSDFRDDIDELRKDMNGLRGEVNGLRGEVKAMDKRLNKKVDDLTEFVTEAIDTANESTAEQVKKHEQRFHGQPSTAV